MSSERLARLMFGLTALLVGYGLVLAFVVAGGDQDGRFATTSGRIVNTLSFFTVQSNILVMVTTGLLAIDLNRPSTVFRVLRLCGLVGIAITGVVFHLALADLQELTGKEAAADWILHTASPVLCIAGWLLFGPRRQVSIRLVGLSLLFPLIWLAYTMVRGALVQDRYGRDYYPYPFLDVVEHGYAVVGVNVFLVAVLFFLVAGGALLLDRFLPGPGAMSDTALSH